MAALNEFAIDSELLGSHFAPTRELLLDRALRPAEEGFLFVLENSVRPLLETVFADATFCNCILDCQI